jgi:rusticyanin
MTDFDCSARSSDSARSSRGNRDLPAPPAPPRDATPRRARIALAAVVIAAVAGCGYAVTGGGGGARAAAGFSSPALAQAIARQAGTALAGRAPQAVSLARTRVLGDQVPAGASVDKASDTITFTGTSVSFTVVAVPPGGPDMTFRVAGLTNPALVVPAGAQVTVQFINGDSDEAHAWLITSEQPPFSFGQPKVPAISGAFSGLIGDPTASGQGASTITFQAGHPGAYQYICPMPGHAQMGMHGAFIVR